MHLPSGIHSRFVNDDGAANEGGVVVLVLKKVFYVYA
jgi:hypothetical protein